MSDGKKTKLEQKLDLLSHCKGSISNLRARIGELESSIKGQTVVLREVRLELQRHQRAALDLASEIPPLIHAEVSGFVGKVDGSTEAAE